MILSDTRPQSDGWQSPDLFRLIDVLTVLFARERASHVLPSGELQVFMHDLAFELRHLALDHKENSYGTRRVRVNMLTLFGTQLHELGYRDLHAVNLKGRHINALLARWREEGLSTSSLKNRMTYLRWALRKLGNPGAMAKTNDFYGIPKRIYTATVSKAHELPLDIVLRVRNPYVRYSLELQRAFGLRMKEAIMIQVHQADKGDRVLLQPKWTKGGRAREIPIVSMAQRELLDRAKTFVKHKTGALIPDNKSYVQQTHSYDVQCRRVGLNHNHGLRHQYAQERFAALAGFLCPVAGGPHRVDLRPEQREADYDARMIVSSELGHNRLEITNVYLGV